MCYLLADSLLCWSLGGFYRHSRSNAYIRVGGWWQLVNENGTHVESPSAPALHYTSKHKNNKLRTLQDESNICEKLCVHLILPQTSHTVCTGFSVFCTRKKPCGKQGCWNHQVGA